ncbi:MAG: ornithine carbamoyltransferase [Gemmatimonadetes bacterium]|nr:MAG: ornithine carbamoyltransferase [Gemmatimonadota bacterium]
MFPKDFLSIADITADDIHNLFDLCAKLKAQTKRGQFVPYLKNKHVALIFHKPSLRTRFSFEVGVSQLGGHPMYITDKEIQLGVRESIYDAAKVMSRFVEGIMIRTFSHDDVRQLAEHADVPVINGLDDLLHPCQVLGDLFTVLEHRGNLNDLKVVFVGDGNNVCNSWLNAASKLPMHFVLARPEGYDPNPEILENAQAAGISTIELTDDVEAAVQDADVLYSDTWTSMGQEAEKAKREAAFAKFQINAELIKRAKPTVLVEHCLPAYRGKEITDEVMDGPHSIVFDEAENRLHIQKAIMVTLMDK